MCDVTNPLCGESGATYTFGKQKGGTPEILDELEKGMCNYRDILFRQFGINMDNVPGSGAAGGLGAALMVFLNGTLKSGSRRFVILSNLTGNSMESHSSLPGRGLLTGSPFSEKVMQGVGVHCKRQGIPAVAIVGSMGQGAEDIFDYGIDSMITTVNGIMPLDEALERAEELYLCAARRLFRMLKAGRAL